MPFVILIIGAIILVTAFHNTFGDLAKELETDLPGFFTWAIAIVAILAIGYIPGLRSPSRWILALVALVLLLTQYQKFFAGFKALAGSGSTPVAPVSSPTPTQGYSANPATTTPPSQTSIAGTAGPLGGPSGGGAGAGVASVAPNLLDPSYYLSSFGVT